MRKALQTLLNALDKIETKHAELTDTDVREQLGSAVESGLLNPVPEYSLPNQFGMYTSEGNRKVKQALEVFFCDAKGLGSRTWAERLEPFEGDPVTSDRGNTFAYYFGGNCQSEIIREEHAYSDRQATAL